MVRNWILTYFVKLIRRKNDCRRVEETLEMVQIKKPTNVQPKPTETCVTSHAMCFNCYFHPSRFKKKKQRGKSVGSTTNLILPNQMLMLKRQKALRRQKGFISRHLRRRRFAKHKTLKKNGIMFTQNTHQSSHSYSSSLNDVYYTLHPTFSVTLFIFY